MAAECLNGIVIGYSDYRDNDRMLTLFTVERGRVDCKARNCRKPTAPLLACAQPFVYGEYSIFFSKDRATVDTCDIRESFYALREDPDRYMAASCAVRLCLSAVEPDMPNEGLFSLLYHTLSFLAYTEGNPKDLLCGFLVHYLDRIGYRPVLTHCAVCHRDVRSDPLLFFSARVGGVVCAACSDGRKPIDRLVLEALRRMLLLSDEELKRIVLPEAVRTEAMRALHALTEEALGAGDRGAMLLEQLL